MYRNTPMIYPQVVWRYPAFETVSDNESTKTQKVRNGGNELCLVLRQEDEGYLGESDIPLQNTFAVKKVCPTNYQCLWPNVNFKVKVIELISRAAKNECYLIHQSDSTHVQKVTDWNSWYLKRPNNMVILLIPINKVFNI